MLSKMKRWNVRSSCLGSLGVDVGCEATGKIVVLPLYEVSFSTWYIQQMVDILLGTLVGCMTRSEGYVVKRSDCKIEYDVLSSTK